MPGSARRREYQRLQEMLIEKRKAAGLTQAELAKRVGRTQSYVSKIEHGERRIDVIEFIDLARALKLDTEQFFRGLRRLRVRASHGSRSTE